VSDLPANRVYEFGPFRLDPAERLLLRDGLPVALTPKAFDLLVYLVERPGHLVGRQALLVALWPDAFVEEANLAYNVSAVRKALGEGQEGEQFIQTVPTRGYRFVAPVHALSRAPEARPARAPRALVGIVAAALAIGALIGGVAVRRLGRSEPPVRPVVRFEIPVATTLRYLHRPAISPDGTRLAYVVGGPKGQLHVRALDSAEAMPLPGTGGALQPFFSPDGQSIGFFAGEHLMKVDLATGHVTKLCPAIGGWLGASWGTDNRIYFSREPSAGILVVSASGGQPEALTEVGPEEVTHGWPELLPGERFLMFSRWDTEVIDDAKIEVVSLDRRERRTVLEGGYGAKYVPTGHLVYVRRGALMAVPFDASRQQLTGTPSKVMEGIAFSYYGVPLFDVSPSGRLAYFPGAAIRLRSDMVWIEPSDRKRQAVLVQP
jgi:eukaryotic-like serine/threonine-protein kinase